MSTPRASKPRPAWRRMALGSPEPASDDRAARQGVFVDAHESHDLPSAASPCVWMSAGLLAYKLCTREFDCEHCPLDAALSGEISAPRERRERIEVREDRRYSPTHAWVQARGAARVRCGIDAFASRLLRCVSAVVLPTPGSTLQRGEPACWLVDDGEPMALLAPVGGNVVHVNDAARAIPSSVASAPYDCWLFELECTHDLPRDAALLDARAMRRRTAQDLRRVRRQAREQAHSAHRAVGPTAHDGGRPVRDLRELLGPERYHHLVRHFLR